MPSGQDFIAPSVTGLDKHYRKSELKDITAIAGTISGPHRAEIEAHGMTALEGIKYSYAMSKRCWTMIHVESGSIAGMFGICDSALSGVGYIWALTNEVAFNNKLRLHRTSKWFLEEAHTHYDILTNYVWEGNQVHMQWLQALGFVIIKEITINNNKFYEFVRIKHCA